MSVHITYFVHGTTTDNERDLATGWLPGELSTAGKHQARELGELVAGKTFDLVFCSDLQRAVDSAELGFGGRYEIVQDKRLRECNYGDLNGAPAADFKNKLEEFVDTPFPNGESYKDVEKRIVAFVDDLKKAYEGKHIAVVAHQAPQLALDVILGGKTWQEAMSRIGANKKHGNQGGSMRLHHKQKVRRFLLVKEVVMILLLVLSFVFLALEHLEQLSHEQLLMIEIYEIGLATLLLAEFLFELHFAKDRAKYWRTHWFYLFAAVPVPTTSFEILRGIRALRLLKLLKIFAEYRYEHNTRLFQKSKA